MGSRKGVVSDSKILPNEFVFVKNWPSDDPIKIDTCFKRFMSYGPIVKVHTLSAKSAYIQYQAIEDAEQAVANLNGVLIAGRKIYVEFKKVDPEPRKKHRESSSGHTIEVLFYLKISHALKQIEKEYDVKVMIDLKHNQIHLEGKKESAERALEVCDEVIEDLCTSAQTKTKEFCKCFKSLGNEQIVQVFQSNHLQAAWDVRGSEIYICSNNPGSVEKAFATIQDLISEFEYPKSSLLSKTQVLAMEKDPEWDVLRQSLEKIFPHLVFVFDENVNKLKLATLASDNLKEIIDKLDRFFDAFEDGRYIAKFTCPYDLILMEMNKTVIEQITPDCTFVFDHDGLVCHISSKDIVMDKIAFYKSTSSIITNTYTIDEPYFHLWLFSAPGKAELLKICQEIRVVFVLNNISISIKALSAVSIASAIQALFSLKEKVVRAFDWNDHPHSALVPQISSCFMHNVRNQAAESGMEYSLDVSKPFWIKGIADDVSKLASIINSELERLSGCLPSIS